MNKKNNLNLISGLKIRNIFPLYIDEINNYFFESTTPDLQDQFSILNQINEVEEDLDEEKNFKLNWQVLRAIQFVINNAIRKVARIIDTKSNSFFVNKKIDGIETYAQEKEDANDFNVLGHKNFNRKYIFAIDIEPNNFLFNFLEQIQFAFYLDEKNLMVTGGVSFNWGSLTNENNSDFQEIIKSIFENDILVFFIKNYLKNVSLQNITSSFDEKEKFNNNFLKQKWEELIRHKFLENKTTSKFLKNNLDVFYSLMIALTSSLIIYEDLRIFFKNKDAQKIVDNFGNKVFSFPKMESFNEKNSLEKSCFDLIIFAKKNYIEEISIKNKDIKKIEDIEDFLEKVENIENESFWSPIVSYEIIRNSDLAFMDEDNDIFLNSKELKTFFLLCLKPEIFGLNNNTDTNISYKKFLNTVKNLPDNEDLENILDKLTETTICDWNYDYITFINQSLNFLIIKNYNPSDFESKSLEEIDPNRKLFNNYFWAIIYTQTRLWKMENIEEYFSENKDKKPAVLRELLSNLNGFKFDWNGDFYGMNEIKKIVRKIEEFFNIEKSIDDAIYKINRADHAFGKSKERGNVAFALVIAAAFGLLDYFTVVFSVLTVSSQNQQNITNDGLIMIIIGSIIAFSLLIAIIFVIYKVYIVKIINKKPNKNFGGLA